MTATGEPREDRLTLVVDTSGSMREHGKAMLARNLVAYVREHQRLGASSWGLGELRVLGWGQEAPEVTLNQEEELPALALGGQAQVRPLLAAMEPLLPGEGVLRVLLISDGHLASADVTAFKAWLRGRPRVLVRALAVGPDAAKATLGELAEPAGVFLAEEVVAALASWARPRELARPEFLADVTIEPAGNAR